MAGWSPGYSSGFPAAQQGQSGLGYGITQQVQPPGEKTPAGYTWDPVQKQYTPFVGSAQQAQEGLQRAQKAQDLFLGQEQEMFNRMATGQGYGSMPIPSLGQMPQAPQFSSPGAPQQIQLTVPDQNPALAAAFARAKDQQGQTTRSAISGLQSALAGRGMLGSGAETRGIRNVVQQGAGALGDLTREQAIQQAQLAQQAAEQAYQGGIQQRGQDIGVQQAAADRALQAWRTQAGVAQTQNQMALDVWKAQQQAQMQQQQLANQAITGLMGSFKGLY